MLKDKKITIQHNTSDGTTDPTWETLQGAENIWAYYRAVSGKEFYAAAQTQAEEDVLFIINYRTDVTAAMRVLYKGVDYGITRIDNFEGGKADIKLYCKVIAAG